MADDPTIAAARDVLAHGLDELRRGVAGLTVDELNARPAGGDTNPVAVIVAHALGSTHSWLGVATGAPLPPRDRPAEFRTVAGDGFADEVEDGIAACLALLGDATFDPGREGFAPWRTDGADEPVTAAFALLHAVAHLGEHVGHLHMTRELLRPGG
ncbi:MAG TPA: DinB family protein [Actinomycetota bacterium]|nr:DinB family protein [Actinomycetota bacterium]